MSVSTREQVQPQFEDAAQQREAASLGMWTFIATEILFFGGVFLGYGTLRIMHSAAFHEGSSHLDITLGSINTTLLLVSSLFMALAEWAVTKRRIGQSILFMSFVLALGIAFLGIKFYEYHHEWSVGHVPVFNWTYEGPHQDSIQIFYFLYFCMTGLHALHMIAGIAVISTLIVLMRKGRVGRERPLPVEMTALYWHFVDIVWIFLFPLLYLIGAGHSSS